MPDTKSDALVVFGATGDLAHKKIFPALQAMVGSGELDVPVVGVGREPMPVDSLLERVRSSVEDHGACAAPDTFSKLARMLRYVGGDYNDAATFDALRKALGDA